MADEKTKVMRMAAPKKKILFVVMDGLGDRGCKALGGKTPLEHTSTPNLDWFAANGSSGIMDIIAPGVGPGSDTAHLSLLGYDPHKVYTGRGPFEAAGIGLIGKRGDVAFRCNFSTVNDKFDVVDRRAGRVKSPETTELIKALSGIVIDGIEVLVKEGTEHRAALLLRGKGLDPDVTDTDPHDVAKVLTSKGRTKGAELTASVVNKFVRLSYEKMKDHPVNVERRKKGLPEANILLTRGAGSFPDILPFTEKNKMSAACVAGVGMIKGICGICGLDVIDVPNECTGGLDTNMIKKADTALNALKKYDFVLMNVKAPDLSGHDGKAEEKCSTIKKLDEMAGHLRKNLTNDVVIAFTADHCTPCEIGDHTGDPVPLTVYTESIVSDAAVKFSESGCAVGRIGRIRGHDLLQICLDLANRSEKFGA
ncbi:MAG: 2,3-bisphosphoglycerate-independent phosphoglycerate mutase [Methanomassiliicoccaceae archaeon]|jgi:2,3-bisphosphoglycerate-independent phosphoglycerate mutase|nr:2,3-bisphosphoglycerate-independent phosphoglycerate mutase [Methanomassiliicoccaceae archaeon]